MRNTCKFLRLLRLVLTTGAISNCELYIVFLHLVRILKFACWPWVPLHQFCPSAVFTCFLFHFRGNSERFGTPPNGSHQVRLHLAKNMLAIGWMCARPLDGSSGPWFCAESTRVRTGFPPWSRAKAGIFSQILAESASERCWHVFV